MEENLSRIEYLALLMDAETENQRAEIIMAYLKAMRPNASIRLEPWASEGCYRYTIANSGWSEGWDYAFGAAPIVLDAMRFAKVKHEGQFRDDGKPYFKHILDVIDILIEDGSGWEDKLLTAALHDVLEDTDATYEELSERFGTEAADTVKLLTKVEGEPFDEYINRIFESDNYDAIAVKLADRLANLRDLPTCGNPDKIKRYVEETNRCILTRKFSPCLKNKIRSAIQRIG